ncbi:uncharacterized protein LOC108156430 [Drosophila miranda]|uniref:uncharacterized protein LOC108156430 n=1 Tax=Drosophila miranda TaxID=7229 RepID=UPI0007E76A2F|nr:uncharacterized protein LOC108156430 [Drosophila miranda]XP_017143374.1 uncharacterized protein LOC108156430 [Drosophila miranda]
MGDLARNPGSQIAGTAGTAKKNDQCPEFWVGHGNRHLAQTEFMLYHIQPGVYFRGRFKERCEERGVKGWFTCNAKAQQVFGVMEGRIKDILSIRGWVEESCILQPFEEKTVFSTFTLCTQPEFTAFSLRLSLPVDKKNRPVSRVLPRTRKN